MQIETESKRDFFDLPHRSRGFVNRGFLLKDSDIDSGLGQHQGSKEPYRASADDTDRTGRFILVMRLVDQ